LADDVLVNARIPTCVQFIFIVEFVMKLIGQILLWAGFLSGSLATVFHSSQKGVEYVTNDSKKLKSATESLVFDIGDEKYTLFNDAESLDKIKQQLQAEAKKDEAPKEVVVLKDFEEAYQVKHGFAPIDMSKVEIPEEGWHLIPWVWYAASAMTCVFGIVLLFKSKSDDGKKSDSSETSLAETKVTYDRLIENIRTLAKDTQTIPPSHIVSRIDDQLADDFRIIADGRDNIAREYGLDVFADVMTQFAAGERAINRAWSAAADGYIDEAANCIDRSLQLLEEAKRILEAGKA